MAKIGKVNAYSAPLTFAASNKGRVKECLLLISEVESIGLLDKKIIVFYVLKF